MSSSPTSSLSRIPLLSVFDTVPDPRDPRGVRHRLPVIVACAAAAVLAGAKSWVAVREWVTDVDRDALSALGIGPDEVLPCESTFRRTLARLNADDLDARLGTWMAARVGEVGGRQVIAFDGKSLRGGDDGSRMPHLLAALTHADGVVVAQQAVPDKGSEIPALRDLLATMDLDGTVVTADALHCQRRSAAFITDAGGDYVLTVKANQPNLRAALKKLPWAQVPAHSHRDRGHGRATTRTVKAIEAPGWVDWPGAAQVIQIRRTRTVKGHKSIEVVYAISSVSMTDAQPAVIASWVQGHWGIENSLHWVRDVTYDEDRHQLRVGAGPHVMASLRNTAISLLRLTGWDNIAAGLRHHARDPQRPITLIATS